MSLAECQGEQHADARCQAANSSTGASQWSESATAFFKGNYATPSDEARHEIANVAIHHQQVGQFQGKRFANFHAFDLRVFDAEVEATFEDSDALTRAEAAIWLPEGIFGTNAKLGIISGSSAPTASKFARNCGVNGKRPFPDNYAGKARFQRQQFRSTLANTATSLQQEGYPLFNHNAKLKALRGGSQLKDFVKNLVQRYYVLRNFTTVAQFRYIDTYHGARRYFGGVGGGGGRL